MTVIPLFGLLEGLVLAFMLAAIAFLIWRLRNVRTGSGPPAVTPAGLQALSDLQIKVAAVIAARDEGGSVTAEDCAELRRLYDRAVAGRVSAQDLAPIRVRMDQLCPSN